MTNGDIYLHCALLSLLTLTLLQFYSSQLPFRTSHNSIMTFRTNMTRPSSSHIIHFFLFVLGVGGTDTKWVCSVKATKAEMVALERVYVLLQVMTTRTRSNEISIIYVVAN